MRQSKTQGTGFQLDERRLMTFCSSSHYVGRPSSSKGWQGHSRAFCNQNEKCPLKPDNEFVTLTIKAAKEHLIEVGLIKEVQEVKQSARIVKIQLRKPRDSRQSLRSEKEDERAKKERKLRKTRRRKGRPGDQSCTDILRKKLEHEVKKKGKKIQLLVGQRSAQTQHYLCVKSEPTNKFFVWISLVTVHLDMISQVIDYDYPLLTVAKLSGQGLSTQTVCNVFPHIHRGVLVVLLRCRLRCLRALPSRKHLGRAYLRLKLCSRSRHPQKNRRFMLTCDPKKRVTPALK